MELKKNVIAFLNMKGGVGKTTLCKEMANYLAEKEEKKILVIDIDPQSNCTQSFFERYRVANIEDDVVLKEKATTVSIHKIFSTSNFGLSEIKLEEVIYQLSENLHIIPGEMDTIFMERETATGSAEQKLINFIDKHNLNTVYDYIFIDCPPTYSFYTISALLSSNYYFVPLKPDAYSLLGLDLLERVVKDLVATYASNFKIKPVSNLGVIFTMAGGSAFKGYERNIQQIKETYEDTNMYFFENSFPKADKLSTGKLATFIIDREDDDLLYKIQNICLEFERRVADLSEEQSEN